jgi:hypothetical protein
MRIFRPAFRVSQRQLVWAVAGLLIAIVVSFIASGNLKEIYEAQPDFVLGSLLASAGYCFAKATTRSSAEKALEELHQTGIVQLLRLVQRDANAALKRLTTYYYSQAESPDFPTRLDLFEVIVDDVDEALANVDRVIRLLGVPGADHSVTYEIKHSVREDLLRYSRSIREALNRRQRTYDWLVANVSPAEHPAVYGSFGNLTSDLLKAHFAMRVLVTQPLRVAPEEQLIELTGYLEAAADRAGEFRAALETDKIRPPGVFETLVKDLTSARKAISSSRLEVPDADRARTPISQ